MLVDITGLKRMERNATAARDYAEAIIRTLHDPLVVLRADLRVNTANPAFYATFKTTPAQTEGCLFFELCGGAWELPKLRQLLESILPRNSFFNDFEVTQEFPHIGRRVMLLNARRLDLADGSPQLILLTINDVTERLRALEATTELAAIVQTTDDAIFAKTLDGVITRWNRGAERMYGYSAEEIVGKHVSTLIPLARRGEGERLLEKVRHGEQVISFDTERVRKDGSILSVLLSITPLEDEAGRLAGAAVIARDITARKQAEEHLQRTLAFDEAVMTSMGEGLYTVDQQGLVTYMNPAAEKHFGWSGEELRGCKMHDMTHHHHPDGTAFPVEECAVFQVLKQGKALIEYEDVFIRKDGRFFPVVFSSSPIRDGDETAGLVVVFRDITDRKQAEDALREADRRKDEFLAMLAHELRNPLAAMLTALDVMRLDVADQRTWTWAREVTEHQVLEMTRLVDDLLDISRISSGKISLRLVPVELASIVAEAVEMSRPLIEAHKHALTVVVPEDPVWMEADTTRLSQVVTNLLNNAAKYTEEGGRISLIAAREGEQIAVRVQDTGMGIPPEMLPKIFDLFTQVDHSLGRAQGGLGVGLTLVRKIVELHGGTVEAFSEGLGQGSTFVVRLPLAPARPQSTATPPEEETPVAGTGRRVLVVDDNIHIAEGLALLLEMSGHDVRTAHNGPAALEAARTCLPDVVLLDIGLRGMDGYEVARRLRESPDLSGVVLVALTGYGDDAHRRRSKEVGFDYHLVKPVNPRSWDKLLAEMVPERKTHGTDTPRGSERTRAG